jgi:hypothetical protein
MSGRTAVQALWRGPAGLSVKNTRCRCRPAMLEDLAAETAGASGASGASPARQMQVALVGRVHVVAHVREAVRCGDAPRPFQGRSY